MGEMYRLDFASGKSYIGISKIDANRRLVQHRWDAAHGSPLLVHRAWRKHGEPVLTVLGTYDWDELLRAEAREIQRQQTLTPRGYNMTTGGRQPVMTPEVISKISAAQKGRALSETHREKLSAAKRGTKRPPEIRARMAEAQRIRRRAEGFEPQKPRINYPRKPRQPTP